MMMMLMMMNIEVIIAIYTFSISLDYKQVIFIYRNIIGYLRWK